MMHASGPSATTLKHGIKGKEVINKQIAIDYGIEVDRSLYQRVLQLQRWEAPQEEVDEALQKLNEHRNLMTTLFGYWEPDCENALPTTNKDVLERGPKQFELCHQKHLAIEEYIDFSMYKLGITRMHPQFDSHQWRKPYGFATSVKPLEHVKKEIARLQEKQIQNNKVREMLAEKQRKIVETQKEYQDIEWQYEVRLQQYQYIEQEKKQLFEKFHNIVYDVHRKTGLRNLILEKKLETIQESLETKDAQTNQILSTARIDPQALGMIRSTLEEVEQLKNEAIREIQTELKKIREAHSNMVKTYEGKLSEFGIPVEELGFDPLVPANI